MFKTTFIILGALFLTGCAGLSKNTISYDPPNKKTVQNTAIIDSDFEKTWDKLVEKLATQYFVINNVSKESRIINVSFSTDDPTDYIDCGKTTRTFIPGAGAGNPETTTYEVASTGTQFKVALPNLQAPGFTIPHLATRKSSLSGRTNIYVAPVGIRSKITVNTRYIYKNSANLVSLINGFSVNTPDRTISFNTGKTGTASWTENGISGTVECVSNGVIERDIINSAK